MRIRNPFKKNKVITHVYLDEDIDYVFCFKRKTIIEDTDCDYHEYNKEMENQDEIFRMTHIIGTGSGICIRGPNGGQKLNECDYFFKKGKPKKYALSYKARKCLKEKKEDEKNGVL